LKEVGKSFIMSENMPSANRARKTSSIFAVQLWSAVGMTGFAIFIATAILLHLIQPEFDPFSRFISEYALGEHGWLLRVALVGNFFGCFALMLLLYYAYPPPFRSWICIIGVGITIITATILTAIFPADLHGKALTLSGHIHNFSALIGTLSMFVVMNVLSLRLHRSGLMQGLYRILPLLALVAPLFFLVNIVIFYYIPGLSGLGQRIFSVIIFTWLLVTLYGIRSGSLTPET
jgi:hypothetical protein